MQRELVQQARQGDDGAFEVLISAAADRLYATATLILHDRTLAEDAVQETMIRAWRDLPRLRDVDRFDAWLRRVLVHTCLDLARAARHPRSELQLGPDVASSGDFARQLAERDAVSLAFAELVPMHRAILVLRPTTWGCPSPRSPMRSASRWEPPNRACRAPRRRCARRSKPMAASRSKEVPHERPGSIRR